MDAERRPFAPWTAQRADRNHRSSVPQPPRERTGSERLKGIAFSCAIIGICALILFGLYAQTFNAGFVYTLAAYVIIPFGIPALMCAIVLYGGSIR